MHANHYLSLVGVADLRAAVQDTVIDAIKGKHHPAHISWSCGVLHTHIDSKKQLAWLHKWQQVTCN